MRTNAHDFCPFPHSLPFLHSVPVLQLSNSRFYGPTLLSQLLHLSAVPTGGRPLWLQINQHPEEPDSPETRFKNARKSSFLIPPHLARSPAGSLLRYGDPLVSDAFKSSNTVMADQSLLPPLGIQNPTTRYASDILALARNPICELCYFKNLIGAVLQNLQSQNKRCGSFVSLRESQKNGTETFGKRRKSR